MGVVPVNGTTIRLAGRERHDGDELRPRLLKHGVHIRIQTEGSRLFYHRRSTPFTPNHAAQIITDGLLFGGNQAEMGRTRRFPADQFGYTSRVFQQPESVVLRGFAPRRVLPHQRTDESLPPAPPTGGQPFRKRPSPPPSIDGLAGVGIDVACFYQNIPTGAFFLRTVRKLGIRKAR